KGLMAAAIRSDNPVVFIEHKGLLLKQAKDFLNAGDVPAEPFVTPIGKADIVRQGGDITLVTLSAGVEYAMEAAGQVAGEGIDVELIDLRSIVPLDVETVAQSVARTGRLLVVDEDYLSFGLSAEIIVRVLERLGPTAVRQLRRHAVPDVPIPAALSLEEVLVPGPASIARVLREMAAAS
ncbi:MAG: transketolase C-terminal domain-containing protein, partial [Pseudomonadota bacterium]